MFGSSTPPLSSADLSLHWPLDFRAELQTGSTYLFPTQTDSPFDVCAHVLTRFGLCVTSQIHLRDLSPSEHLFGRLPCAVVSTLQCSASEDLPVEIRFGVHGGAGLLRRLTHSHKSAVPPGGNVRTSTAVSLSASLSQDNVVAFPRGDNYCQLYER